MAFFNIINLAYLVAGLGLSYILYEISLRKNRALYSLIKNVKKKKQIPIFLETDKASYLKFVDRVFKNIGVTTEKELVVIPKSSAKPCLNLGGIVIAHGDVYKSVTVPTDLIKFVKELKDGKFGEKWSNEEIAKFFQEIEHVNAEKLKDYLKQFDGKKKIKKINEDGEKVGINVSPMMSQKFKIYMAMPSVVKDFIYTGINRVSLHDMLREMVYQRELEKMGSRNWIMYAIAILIVLLGVYFLLKSPAITQTLVSVVSKSPSRVAP